MIVMEWLISSSSTETVANVDYPCSLHIFISSSRKRRGSHLSLSLSFFTLPALSKRTSHHHCCCSSSSRGKVSGEARTHLRRCGTSDSAHTHQLYHCHERTMEAGLLDFPGIKPTQDPSLIGPGSTKEEGRGHKCCMYSTYSKEEQKWKATN